MGKNNVESSLKRFLKRKVKITMGFVVAFMITGTIGFAENINKENETLNMSGYEESLKADNISIITKTEANNGTGINNKGIFFDSAGAITTKKIIANDINININHDWANGIVAYYGANLDIKTNKIDIDVISEHIPTKNPPNYSSKWDTNIVYGIRAEKFSSKNPSPNGGIINIEADTVDIFAKVTGLIKDEENGKEVPNYAYGISTSTPNYTDKDITSEINIKAKDTIIKVEAAKKEYATGIVAWSKGKIAINDGNLYVDAGKAISARGDSAVEINKNSNQNYTVVLNGDILFEYDLHSQTPVDADVTIKLANSQSKFTGKVNSNITSGSPNDDKLEYTGMKLGLSNGATWKVTGDSFVNDLTMDGGIIEVTNDVDNINVDRLHGNSGTAMFAASVDGEGVTVTDGKLNIDSSSKTALKVGLSGVNADDLAANDIGAADAFNKLVGKVTGSGVDNITQTAVIERGILTGEITAELNKDGFTNMKQAQDTPTIAAIRDLTAINYLSWKQEMSSLSQRMAELRDSSAEHGVWARVYGGKVENGSQYDNEYQTYQVGYDKKYTVDNGRVYLGYLVSYTDGETDYSYGTGENYSVGAGIYATWMNNNGHYVDVLYKVSRLNNKFDMKDVEDVKGDYDTYGISLSAEYGKRFDITDKWFAEPSVGMHLGRLGDETYTTDGGIEISQDSIYTAEGRVGAAVGYKFSDKGNVYARTHVVKEFAGEVDTEYERNGVYASTSEDFGDTWFEFGVGVNYRFTENMNVYADIERTGDSTVDTKWQGNLGFRYEF